MKHDIVMRGGNIIDGTGTVPFVGDIAVNGGIGHRRRRGFRYRQARD